MNLKRFTIFDSKAEASLPPFYRISTGVALRDFEASCNDPNHDFSKYGGDYTLFELGSYDQATMMDVHHPAPINLGLALTFQKRNEDS